MTQHVRTINNQNKTTIAIWKQKRTIWLVIYFSPCSHIPQAYWDKFVFKLLQLTSTGYAISKHNLSIGCQTGPGKK